jgi:hypothetical protein
MVLGKRVEKQGRGAIRQRYNQEMMQLGMWHSMIVTKQGSDTTMHDNVIVLYHGDDATRHNA